MKSLTLAQIQTLLHSSIRHQQTSEKLLHQIKDVPPIPVRRRIGIYQDAYRIRLSECIQEDFVKTCDVMGNAHFENYLWAYVGEAPSTTSQLAEYSEGFVEYLKDQSPIIYETAAKEWLDILTSRAQEPNDKLSLTEIQAGISFVLQLHPATKMKVLPHKAILSYRISNETHFLDLQEREIHWHFYFQQSRTLEELSAFIEKGDVSEEVLMTLIFDWIQKGILYCSPRSAT